MVVVVVVMIPESERARGEYGVRRGNEVITGEVITRGACMG